ncbi:enoyl-CoA hydratase-related protein [Streptomyces sp. V3I7]|uniref:enoyl-CoA hydratase-related protein n=1 Tax=Streptomyces sp. V3I7 TaxID=3042278 RepID=UPI0027861331|nr:enoyl-CoA hydratase-related protein [Streptomyces sp. V3I7]MDQ0989338.1 crotonobetainyl-CoA hydratase [Streptomyces sp. V3I7]
MSSSGAASTPPPTSPPPPAALTERHGHTLLVTLNRPHVMNAVDAALSAAVGGALEEAEHDPDVWAVVLTGAGDRAFCAGADLKALARGESLHAPGHPEWGFAGYVRHAIGKPTIAAVNGLALGGGTELTLASDLAVAADTAAFGLPEVSRGIFAAAGGVFRLAQQLPRKAAMEMILTGEPVTAARALELDLVNRVVPAAEVVDAALALAERICANAPLAVQASKRVALGILDGRIPDEESAWAHSDREIRALLATHDAQEGPRAFAEKRSPQWQAR